MHFEYISIVRSTPFIQGGGEYNQTMGELYIIILVKCLCPLTCVQPLKVGHNKS